MSTGGSKQNASRGATPRGRRVGWAALAAVVLAVAFMGDGWAGESAGAEGNPDAVDRVADPGLGKGGSPSWSPDGTRIVFYSERDGNAEIYAMDTDGSNLERLTRDPAADGYPNFSPDGTLVSFDTDRDGNFEIYVMGSDASNPRRLTHHPARDVSASWSPDGSRIAFMSDRTGRFEIWIMDADGSDPVQITDFGTNWFPRWSPDGQELAYHVGRDVFVLNVEERRYRRLTIDPDNGMYPTWSPDGERIAFMSWRTGSTELWVMNADGSKQRRLTWTEQGEAIDPRWSPDGVSVVYVHVPEGQEVGGPKIIHTLRVDGS